MPGQEDGGEQDSGLTPSLKALIVLVGRWRGFLILSYSYLPNH